MKPSILMLVPASYLLCNAAWAQFPFEQDAPVSFAFTSQSCHDLKPNERMRCERYGATFLNDCQALGNARARHECLLGTPDIERPAAAQARTPNAPPPAIPFLQAPPQVLGLEER